MCISPLKGFQIGWNPSGKPQYKICSYDTDHVEYRNTDQVKTWQRKK